MEHVRQIAVQQWMEWEVWRRQRKLVQPWNPPFLVLRHLNADFLYYRTLGYASLLEIGIAVHIHQHHSAAAGAVAR